MGKPTPKGGTGKKGQQQPKGKGKGKGKGKDKQDRNSGVVDKQERAAKRRERRQSKIQGSKRQLRRGQRDESGRTGAVGKGVGKGFSQISAAVHLKSENPHARAFYRYCLKFSKKAERAQAEALQAIDSAYPALIQRALNCITPASFFSDTPLQGPKGFYVNPLATLEFLTNVTQGGKFKVKPIAAASAEQQEGKDKPSESSISRAKQILKAREPTLHIFEHLRSHKASERAAASKEMVRYLTQALASVDRDALAKADDNVAAVEKLLGPVPSYVVTRLVKGLSGGGEGSRLGFTSCLVLVLSELSFIPSAYILARIERDIVFTGVTDGMQGGAEQKQVAWGLLFAILSLLSARKEHSRVSVMVMVEKLLSIYTGFRQAREAVATTFVEMLFPSDGSSPSETVHKILIPKLFSTLFESGSVVKAEAWAPETLYLFLTLSRRAESLLTHSDKMAALQASVNLTDRATLGTHLRLLLTVSTKKDKRKGQAGGALEVYPRVHTVWPALVEHVKATAQGSKRGVEAVIEDFWGTLSKATSAKSAEAPEDEADEEAAEAEAHRSACQRQVVRRVLRGLLGVLVESEDREPARRLQLLSRLSNDDPRATNFYIELCSESARSPVFGEGHVQGLINRFRSILSEETRKVFDESAPAVPEKKSKRGSKKDDDDSVDESMDGDSDAEKDDAEDEDGEANSDDESAEESDEDEGRSAGYGRFRFNLLKACVKDIARVTRSAETLQKEPAAFEQACMFLMTHGFFSVPSGTVDAEGLFSVESVPLVMRKMMSDSFLTALRFASASAGSKNTSGWVFAFIPKAMKAFDAALRNPSAEALFPVPDASQPQTLPERKLEKQMKQTLLKLKAPSGDARHGVHFATLYALIYFNFILDFAAFEGVEDMTSAMAAAASDVASGIRGEEVEAGSMLESLMVVNLRTQPEAMAHIASLIHKTTQDIIAFSVCKQVKDPEAIRCVLTPLMDNSQFAVVDEDDEPMAGDDSDNEEDDDDEAPDTAAPSAALPTSHATRKAEQEELLRQLLQVRSRAVSYLSLLVKGRGSSDGFLATWGPVAQVALARAQDSLPVKKAAQKVQRESLLQACSSLMGDLAKVHALATPDDVQLASISEAFLEMCGVAGCAKGRKEVLSKRLMTPQGRALRRTAAACVRSGAVAIANYARKHSGTKAGAAAAQTLKDGFALIFTSREMLLTLPQDLAPLADVAPHVLSLALLPALQASVGPETGRRPFNLQVLYDLAVTLAAKWPALNKLKEEDAATHTATLKLFIGLAQMLTPTTGGEGVQATKNAEFLPPLIKLNVSVARYLASPSGSKELSESFCKKARKTIPSLVKNLEFINKATRAALRMAWEYIKPEGDYSTAISDKALRPKEPKKKRAQKQKRGEDAQGDDLEPTKRARKEESLNKGWSASNVDAEEAERQAAANKVSVNRGAPKAGKNEEPEEKDQAQKDEEKKQKRREKKIRQNERKAQKEKEAKAKAGEKAKAPEGKKEKAAAAAPQKSDEGEKKAKKAKKAAKKAEN